MDKVFVVVVVTLSYRVSGDGNAEYTTLRDAQQAILATSDAGTALNAESVSVSLFSVL